MGGQLDYFGLWISAKDFMHGHSKAGPRCSTYDSPQLSKRQEFRIDEMEGLLSLRAADLHFHCAPCCDSIDFIANTNSLARTPV